MSLFYPMDGEHLAGFIFRKHIFSGNIIDREFSYGLTLQGEGSWRVLPFRNTDDYSFETYRQHTLLSLFRPLSDRHASSHRHFADYVSAHIKYCPVCFKDQISEFGFYWFRREWLIYETDVCLKHSCHLTLLKCVNCYHTNGLSSFFRGICTKCRGRLVLLDPVYTSSVPPMIAWANQILERDFPLFSRRLIMRLFHRVYESREGNICPSNSKLAHYLYEKCVTKYQRPELNVHSSEIMTGTHKYIDILKLLDSNEKFHLIPFLLFWKVMILEFEAFSSFTKYIESISKPEIDINDRGFPLRYLELI